MLWDERVEGRAVMREFGTVTDHDVEVRGKPQ